MLVAHRSKVDPVGRCRGDGDYCEQMALYSIAGCYFSILGNYSWTQEFCPNGNKHFSSFKEQVQTQT